MSQKRYMQVDYDKEIGRVDKAILALRKELEDLVYKRYELIAQKHNINTDELMECIVEHDLIPKEVVDLINSAVEKKSEHC